MRVFLKKIFLIFKNILIGKIKLKFGLLENYKIFVYNSDSMSQLQFVLENKNFIILDYQIENLKEIYISYTLVLELLKNFKKFNLSKNYFYSIIKISKPKIVITGLGNHSIFCQLAKLLDKNIDFIAVQNARRSDFERNEYDFEKKILSKNLNPETYIPHFFCFGQYEIDNAKIYNVNIKKFYKEGSINTANFFYYLKKNHKKIIKDKYDICLISEPAFGENERYKSSGVEEGYGRMANYTVKFAKKFNHKFIFAAKRAKKSALYPSDLYKKEINFFKTHLDKENFEFLLDNINPKENFFSSYTAIFQSKVAVGTQSTLLRDKIGVGEKILSCNLTGLKIQDFPINGICKINNCSYEQFEERLTEIMNIPINKYFEKIDKHRNYVMEFKNPFRTIDAVKEKIDKILKRL